MTSDAESIGADGAGLRVLVVHHRYRSAQPSGENQVVDDEVGLLRDYGAEVEQLELRGDDIEGFSPLKKAMLPFRVVWSREGQALLENATRRFRPDVIHVHNTFPLFSPAIFYTAAKSGAGVVYTLHNFRPLCPAGTFLRDGKPCELCLGRLPVPAVRYACYRDSRLATLPVAVMDGVHAKLRTWQRRVDRIIVLSGYERDKYVEAGWPGSKIRIKYNTIRERALPPRQPGRHFLSMSRLVPEKGVDVLLEGWKRAFPSGGPPLHLTASGDAFDELYGRYGELPDVSFLGQVERSVLYDELVSARAVIVPSRCYEGFPRVVAEAYAVGVPIVASRTGSLTELVEEGVTGLQTTVGDPDDMARALRLLADDELAARLGRGARERYERMYSAEVTMQVLFGIYREAMAAKAAA
jgi:glycosyltransferase involved in cell wall biosynthesis